MALISCMAAEPAAERANKSMILEFRVDHVDEEYKRVTNMGIEIIKPLTTQAHGNTSFWFKDPDGNFLNFYSR